MMKIKTIYQQMKYIIARIQKYGGNALSLDILGLALPNKERWEEIVRTAPGRELRLKIA